MCPHPACRFVFVSSVHCGRFVFAQLRLGLFQSLLDPHHVEFLTVVAQTPAESEYHCVRIQFSVNLEYVKQLVPIRGLTVCLLPRHHLIQMFQIRPGHVNVRTIPPDTIDYYVFVVGITSAILRLHSDSSGTEKTLSASI